MPAGTPPASALGGPPPFKAFKRSMALEAFLASSGAASSFFEPGVPAGAAPLVAGAAVAVVAAGAAEAVAAGTESLGVGDALGGGGAPLLSALRRSMALAAFFAS